MQSVFAAVGRLLSDKPENAQLTHAYLPVFFGRVLMLADKIPAWSKAVIKRVSAMTLTVDIELFDENGQCVGLLQDLRLRVLPKRTTAAGCLHRSVGGSLHVVASI